MGTAISGWDIVEKWGHFSNWRSQKSFFQTLKEKSRPGISLVGKHLEENIGKALDDVNQSKILYNPPPRVMEIKTKNKVGPN